ncbi:MAG TPA: hypothetical protein VFR18_20355 [Terriglobia bacterium]|nr:hypothetical protein [Terriglobia bacterium]
MRAYFALVGLVGLVGLGSVLNRADHIRIKGAAALLMPRLPLPGSGVKDGT